MRYIKLIDRGYTSLTAFVMLSDEVIDKLKEFKNKHGDKSYKELLYYFKKKFNLIIFDDCYLNQFTELGYVAYSVTLSEVNSKNDFFSQESAFEVFKTVPFAPDTITCLL